MTVTGEQTTVDAHAGYADASIKRVTAENGIEYAYRDVGESEVPVVLLQHFRGNLDNWDPALIDDLAAQRRVVAFDNVGVGGTTGTTPSTIEAMAHGAIAFLDAMELQRVDLLGFSIGSFVAQEIALIRPQLLRRVVLASSAPQGAAGMHGPWVDRPIGGSVRVCTCVHGRRPAGRSALGPNGGTRGKNGNQSPHSNQLDTIRKPSRSATTSASRDSWPRSTMNRFGLDAMAKNCCVVSGIVPRHVSPAHSHAKASGAKADSPLIPSLTQNNL